MRSTSMRAFGVCSLAHSFWQRWLLYHKIKLLTVEGSEERKPQYQWPFRHKSPTDPSKGIDLSRRWRLYGTQSLWVLSKFWRFNSILEGLFMPGLFYEPSHRPLKRMSQDFSQHLPFDHASSKAVIGLRSLRVKCVCVKCNRQLATNGGPRSVPTFFSIITVHRRWPKMS